jgi:hypothetical protein
LLSLLHTFTSPPSSLSDLSVEGEVWNIRGFFILKKSDKVKKEKLMLCHDCMLKRIKFRNSFLIMFYLYGQIYFVTLNHDIRLDFNIWYLKIRKWQFFSKWYFFNKSIKK